MPTVAVVNAGSSSLKFAIFDSAQAPALRLRGLIDGIGATPRLRLSNAAGEALVTEAPPADGFDHAAATQMMMRVAAPWLDGDIRAVGHRVVHGGADFSAPARVTPAILRRLESFIPLAPLHQPHNLAVIRVLLDAHPELPQIACFDTAFHRSAPPIAQAFALPRRFAEAGVRRYGFHGLSYQYVARRLTEIAPGVAGGRVIIAHLGNGASLCALRDGRSQATTMGFTAVDGLMMGTRCGALDPGVMLYLMDEHAMGARELEALIYRQSGLLGVSGVSSDMRALRASPEPSAREAIDLFVYRILREIGSLAAALGGLDALVFTAGIGENDADTRAAVVAGCAWLGATLDPEANLGGATRISAGDSRVEVLVVPTNEELEIARSVYSLLPAG
jgi:acetate kinase